jgi:hypothetical protein
MWPLRLTKERSDRVEEVVTIMPRNGDLTVTSDGLSDSKKGYETSSVTTNIRCVLCSCFNSRNLLGDNL